jgi:hypothetical protein
MAFQGMLSKQYGDRLKSLYHTLAAERYYTYVFTAWSEFEVISAGTLQSIKSELRDNYGLELVYSMGIFELNRPFLEKPHYHNFFDEVLIPQDDDESLTTEEVFDAVLTSVSVVLFDNSDHDPFIQTILDKAKSCGKRMIDVNANGGS